MAPTLDTLPHEILHMIFTCVEAADLAALSYSCATLNEYISGNVLLCKDQYLKSFDHLDHGCTEEQKRRHDWVEQLHRLVKLEKILGSTDVACKRANLGFVAATIISLLESAEPSSEEPLNRAFLMKYFDAHTPSKPERTVRILSDAQNNLVIQSILDNDSGKTPDSPPNQLPTHPAALNVQSLLSSSSLFSNAGSRSVHAAAPTEDERQLSAQLHVLFGQPIDFDDPDYQPESEPSTPPTEASTPDSGPDRGRACKSDSSVPRPTHPYARAKVYDLREYTKSTRWGPFRADGSGRVDWEKLEAIMVVLGYNLRLMEIRTHGGLQYEWNRPFYGTAAHSFRPRSQFANVISLLPRRETRLTRSDPYNVTGTWMRVVCFLDYSDLYNFNFTGDQPEPGEARRPIETEEATRMIVLSLVAVDVRDAEEGEGMLGTKIVQYEGRSRSMHDSWDPNANSSIRGTIRTTPTGAVSWTSFSVFHGEERWRSEGVQIGGAGSARGVLGTWFDKDFEPEGPAGPTAYWKVSDKLSRNDGELQDRTVACDEDGADESA